MILIFGGTTEGKKVAELFDITGQEYFYSTKTNAHKDIKGERVYGGMDAGEMREFCIRNGIRLIIDAAHPFAVQLHKNIFKIATELGIDVIRYERRFPSIQESSLLRYFDSYDDLIEALSTSKFDRILALTGVQTISKLKPIWVNKTCYFRILDTDLSREKARQTGIDTQYVIPMHPEANSHELVDLSKKLNVDILLSKESGESGYFETKVEAAQELNIPLWVVKRPALPEFANKADNPKDFLQVFYRLKKTALKQEGTLRSGYTTGTCVTAAAKACLIALMEKEVPSAVEVQLPGGEIANIPVFLIEKSDNKASCMVIKDAGDDPDVTHAKEIGCELSFSKDSGIHFLKGEGIGMVTLPGLQVAVGEPAINPVPRLMISNMLEQLAGEYDMDLAFEVKPFVPEGEELAKQTFNPRIGIVGGISIIGTSGKVMPYSLEAFLSSIKQQINIAKELGCQEVVITSGKRSENVLAPEFPDLPAQAFIHFGNMIGETIKLAVTAGIQKINLAIMLGKAVKLAEGNMDTHSKNVVFNPGFVADLAESCGHPKETIQSIKQQKLANAILDIIPVTEDEPFYKLVAQKCLEQCLKIVPERTSIKVFLIAGEHGVIAVM